VQKVVVIVRKDQTTGKRLVAYVVPKERATPTGRKLRRFLRQKLPDYMLPSVFVLLDELPLTPNKKINRRALPAPDTSRIGLEQDFAPPRTPTEKALANAWARVLGLEKVGLYDNFFELGGHSLLGTQLILRLHELLQVNLPLRSLFEEPTVAGLAKHIETIRLTAQILQSPPGVAAEELEEGEL
jgi:acyl carrier protein